MLVAEEIQMAPRKPSPTRSPQAKPPQVRSGRPDLRWHLARTPLEIEVAELEYAVMRAFEAFGRWQVECLANVIDFTASGPENALLHIIRMNERPKSIRDLAYMANREDIPNIQYSLRKLIKGGLVVRSGSGRAGVSYEVTPLGREVTDQYAEVRAALLINAIRRVPAPAQRLKATAQTLDLMVGIYAQAARTAATHRRRPTDRGEKTKKLPSAAGRKSR
jgi:predicted MarR family transcription regulator